jgi:catalase
MSKSLVALAMLLVIVGQSAVGVAEETSANPKSMAEQLVDAFNAVFGVHPGIRANHSKGVVLKGTFTPSAAAASFSKAAHFKQHKTPVPVTVRFSDGSGLPTVPDTEEMPRGMAVKFALPDGSTTDLVLLSVNGFPAATAEEFRDFLLAIAASGPDAPKPTPIETFIESHPAAKAFVHAPKPPPVSFGTLPYFGINAFKLTNAKGVTTHVRYQLQPIAGTQVLSKEQISTKDSNYLTTEIGERLGHGPVKFKMLAQVAEKNDKVDDPTILWPASRKTIELGTITITTVVQDSQAAEKKLLFVPGALVPGIEPADPMIAARSAAYIVSLARRSQAQ